MPIGAVAPVRRCAGAVVLFLYIYIFIYIYILSNYRTARARASSRARAGAYDHATSECSELGFWLIKSSS